MKVQTQTKQTHWATSSHSIECMRNDVTAFVERWIDIVGTPQTRGDVRRLMRRALEKVVDKEQVDAFCILFVLNVVREHTIEKWLDSPYSKEEGSDLKAYSQMVYRIENDIYEEKCLEH